jgi:hypothetical protein
MEIPLQAQVECTDGVCGHSMYVLINPVVDQVTHLVVKVDSSNTEYIVPIDLLSETIADTIQLNCTKAELEKTDPFVKITFVEEQGSTRDFIYGSEMHGMGSHYYMPYGTPDVAIKVPVEQRQIPYGEMAVQRGTRVEATDGYVGKVDEFVINPQNGHISHLVMREGYLWGRKDMIIPLSAMMGDTSKDTVFLKLNKHQIESLPTFPIHRHRS